MTKQKNFPLLFLVDDDEDDKSLLQDALRRYIPAAVFKLFSDGKEVFVWLQNSLVNLPDLIILDLNMPLMCGQDLLRWLRGKADYRNIPVLIFSTSHSGEDECICKKLGADDYITKPSDISGYQRIAAEICKRWFRKQGNQASAV